MTNAVKKGNGSAGQMLPADFIQRLEAGIAESRATTVIAGGKPFLRLKGSDWMYGQENIDVEPGSQWQVNVMSLAHGWCCWVRTGEGTKNEKAELRGEIMVSMSEPRPPMPPPIDGHDYSEQRAFDLKCVSGEDAGTEVHYKTNSTGGKGAVFDLLGPIQEQLRTNPAFPCPVLTLSQRHYDHRQYGRTYVPVFDIVGWADMQGVLAGAAAAAPEQPDVAPEEEEAPAPRRRGRPAQVPPNAFVEEEAPVSTQQAHVAQRRRPNR